MAYDYPPQQNEETHNGTNIFLRNQNLLKKIKACVYVSKVITTIHAKEKERTISEHWPNDPRCVQSKKKRRRKKSYVDDIRPYMLGRVSDNMVDKLIVLDYLVLRFIKAGHVNGTSHK